MIQHSPCLCLCHTITFLTPLLFTFCIHSFIHGKTQVSRKVLHAVSNVLKCRILWSGYHCHYSTTVILSLPLQKSHMKCMSTHSFVNVLRITVTSPYCNITQSTATTKDTVQVGIWSYYTNARFSLLAHNWLNVKVKILSPNDVQKTTLYFGQYPLKNIPMTFYLLYHYLIYMIIHAHNHIHRYYK